MRRYLAIAGIAAAAVVAAVVIFLAVDAAKGPAVHRRVLPERVVESSLQRVADDVGETLENPGDVYGVACRPSGGPNLWRCAMHETLETVTDVDLEYRVRVARGGCWRAKRISLEQDTDSFISASSSDVPSVLTGCAPRL